MSILNSFICAVGLLTPLAFSACAGGSDATGGAGTTASGVSHANATTNGGPNASASATSSSTGQVCPGESGSGEGCMEAIDASCGGTFTGSTVGEEDRYQTCNVGGVFGGDRAYVVHSPVPQRFTVRVEPDATTPDYQIAIHVKRDCAKMFECLSESMIHTEGGVPGTVQSVFDLGAGETAYVIVDGVALDVPEDANGDYKMTITRDAAPAATDCTNAIDVSDGGSYGSTTRGASDDQNGSGCSVQKAGEDRVYTIMTAESRTYDLWMDQFSGSGMPDLAIYVKTDCAAQSCVPETKNNMLGGPHRLLLTTEPGVRYYVVVDGDMSPGVNYILHVNPTATCCDPLPDPGSATRG